MIPTRHMAPLSTLPRSASGRRASAGFTYVEVLVAGSLLALTLLGVCTMFVAGYANGPTLHLEGDSAYYSPSRDEVHLPPRASFRDMHGYYATLFHEIGTGASVLLAARPIGVAR